MERGTPHALGVYGASTPRIMASRPYPKPLPNQKSYMSPLGIIAAIIAIKNSGIIPR